MRIKKITITDFRNYQNTEIEFDKGINSLYGRNGSGKTNIVEAIDYLTIGKSFRADNDIELVRFDQEFARIEVQYFKEKDSDIKVVISKDGKRFFLNGIELKKLSELSGNLIDVLFTPKDALLFKDTPSVRRRLIDVTIASIDKNYLKQLAVYKALLKERNAALKEENVDQTYIEIVTQKMIEPQYYISSKRHELFSKINALINQIYKKIDDEENEIRIDYQAFVSLDDMEKYQQTALRKYKASKENDMRRKSTNEGIHHEDFKTYLNGHEIDLYGSQGQNRLSCLALKLFIYEIIKDAIKEDPILILDDVLSELDENHQIKLINYLANVEQTFITTAEMNETLEKYKTFEILNDAVARR